jgi:hypothetical protein
VCTSIPIYFVLSIKKGAPFWRGSSGTLKTYSKWGALLYCVVVLSETGFLKSAVAAFPFVSYLLAEGRSEARREETGS